jgi:phosphate-induced protein 1
MYYIWYGNWTGNSAKTILTDLASSLGGSPYWNINTTYYNGSGTHISNSLVYGGSVDDNYSQGSSLTDAKVKAVVDAAINGGGLPRDASGIYFVLTSADVSETSGFCSVYCGWHTYGANGGTTIKYSFVGDAARCITACAAQTTGPNGNAGADGMASIIAHEAEEAATDPQLNAWYFNSGQENADKCAWTFGTTYTSGNGAQANMHLGSRDYLIQQNWNAGSSQRCRLTYP